MTELRPLAFFINNTHVEEYNIGNKHSCIYEPAGSIPARKRLVRNSSFLSSVSLSTKPFVAPRTRRYSRTISSCQICTLSSASRSTEPCVAARTRRHSRTISSCPTCTRKKLWISPPPLVR